MKFKLDSDMNLSLYKEDKMVKVSLKSCFPITRKEKYFSVCDKDNKELEFLEDLTQLDQENRITIEKYLRFNSFRFKITGVFKVEEDFGLRHFEVKTSVGDRNFQTSLNTWPKLQDDGSYIIQDIFGDQYLLGELGFGHDIIASYID